ncbi:MAG: cobyrinate a,c-diamide synthase [Hyphomicrobiaceae bacterium]
MGNNGGLVIAAPHSGSGKTTVTVGIVAALRARGLSVGVAKCGPDYIDPKFLEAAAGRPCATLDPWAMSTGTLSRRYATLARDVDVVVVEGAMGLFDGAASGGGATADLASDLGLPVVLLVDASRQSQSIAALVHGFSTFRDDVEVAGAIATRIGSARHGEIVAQSLGALPVAYLGALPHVSGLKVASRHLGLVQASEHNQIEDLIAEARRAVSHGVDLEQLMRIAGGIRQMSDGRPMCDDGKALMPIGQRIALAQDVAFGFTYPHVLDDWRRAGAEILPFSPLNDDAPHSTCDAIFLPGGYPELYAARLSTAHCFAAGVRAAAARRAAIYGECGGYMVLGKGLVDSDGQFHRMLGLLGHTTTFEKPVRHLGYRIMKTCGDVPLPAQLRGHEFHYSTLLEPGKDLPLFSVCDSNGASIGYTGGRRGSVFGSYLHIVNAWID